MKSSGSKFFIGLGTRTWNNEYELRQLEDEERRAQLNMEEQRRQSFDEYKKKSNEFWDKKKATDLERKKKEELERKQKQIETKAQKEKEKKRKAFEKRRQGLYPIDYDEAFAVEEGWTAALEEEDFTPAQLELSRGGGIGGKSSLMEGALKKIQNQNRKTPGNIKPLKRPSGAGGTADVVGGGNVGYQFREEGEGGPGLETQGPSYQKSLMDPFNNSSPSSSTRSSSGGGSTGGSGLKRGGF